MKTGRQFGTRLHQERLRRHLSQEALAEALEVSPKSISRWEQGLVLPHGSLRLRLSHFLGLRAEDLFEDLIAQTPPVLLWSVPHPRNPFFTGREEIFAALHTHLTLARGSAFAPVCALQGLGGIGKTQIALEYTYRYASEYSAIFWIEAETIEHILSSALNIAELLQLPERRNADQWRVVAAVQRWLAAHPWWLLVWDNLTDPEQLYPWLPATGQGTVLITTNNQALGTLAQGIDLAPMGQEEGMLLVLRRSKALEPKATLEHMRRLALSSPPEYAAAEELVSALGGLPLALDQAGAYIEETGCSLADYLRRYEQQRSLLLDRRGLPEEHPGSVTATFLLACQQVQQLERTALDMLRACAFLHAEAIPEELFAVGAVHLGPELMSMAADVFQFDQAIAALRRFSLVQRHPETHTFSLHRLVQAVLRESMNAQEQVDWLKRIIAALNSLFPAVISSTWKQCERLHTHVLAVAAALPDDRADPILAEVLQKVADYFRERHRYTQAQTWYEQALQIWERVEEPRYPDIVHVLNGLGLLCYDQGKYEQAQTWYEQALNIGEQSSDPAPTEVFRVLNNLAILFQTRGRYMEAEVLYCRTLDLLEQTFEPEHLYFAYLFNNLAGLHIKQGKYEQVELFCQRALDRARQTLGPAHSVVASFLLTLAEFYAVQGKDEQAKPLYEQALHIREQELDATDPYVAEVLNQLADLYAHQGKDELAEALYQRALHIWEQVRGLEHPDVAIALNGLASLSMHQGKDELAEALYQRALKLREQRLGQDHPDTAQTLHDLALFYQKQGSLSKARAYAKRAFKIRVESLGIAHSKTVATHICYTQLSLGQEE